MGGKLGHRSKLEEMLAIELTDLGVPPFARQYKFHPTRKWLLDFAWPELKVAVEVEGGTWVRGRHTRPEGYARDCEKYNAAALLGWQVYRFTGDAVSSGEAARFIQGVVNKYAGDV